MNSPSVREIVQDTFQSMTILDIHTHLFDPALGDNLLSGIDELLTYHYLLAEFFRACPQRDPDAFYAGSKEQQADEVWQALFVERSPITESGRGVIRILDSYGLPTDAANLKDIRAWFQAKTLEEKVSLAFEKANISAAYMTNDPLDPNEGPHWKNDFQRDPRFPACLRLDSALIGWNESGKHKLREMGYELDGAMTYKTFDAVKQYLRDWCDRMDARYMAISLPPTFRYPDLNSPTANLLAQAVFPVAQERGLPVGLMIGVRRQVNPRLRLAGDAVGKMDIESLERLALEFPDVQIITTLLARENQHELCVSARKFANLLPFGCWWYVNNPTLIREITRMRTDMLGFTFIPQHSDCRVLEQLVYKWQVNRELMAEVFTDKYEELERAGWRPCPDQIRKDLTRMLDGSLLRSPPAKG